MLIVNTIGLTTVWMEFRQLKRFILKINYESTLNIILFSLKESNRILATKRFHRMFLIAQIMDYWILLFWNLKRTKWTVQTRFVRNKWSSVVRISSKKNWRVWILIRIEMYILIKWFVDCVGVDAESRYSDQFSLYVLRVCLSVWWCRHLVEKMKAMRCRDSLMPERVCFWAIPYIP